MFVSYPLGRDVINSSAFAILAAFSTQSMLILPAESQYPIFSATVPENRF